MPSHADQLTYRGCTTGTTSSRMFGQWGSVSTVDPTILRHVFMLCSQRMLLVSIASATTTLRSPRDWAIAFADSIPSCLAWNQARNASMTFQCGRDPTSHCVRQCPVSFTNPRTPQPQYRSLSDSYELMMNVFPVLAWVSYRASARSRYSCTTAVRIADVGVQLFGS